MDTKQTMSEYTFSSIESSSTSVNSSFSTVSNILVNSVLTSSTASDITMTKSSLTKRKSYPLSSTLFKEITDAHMTPPPKINSTWPLSSSERPVFGDSNFKSSTPNISSHLRPYSSLPDTFGALQPPVAAKIIVPVQNSPSSPQSQTSPDHLSSSPRISVANKVKSPILPATNGHQVCSPPKNALPIKPLGSQTSANSETLTVSTEVHEVYSPPKNPLPIKPSGSLTSTERVNLTLPSTLTAVPIVNELQVCSATMSEGSSASAVNTNLSVQSTPVPTVNGNQEHSSLTNQVLNDSSRSAVSAPSDHIQRLISSPVLSDISSFSHPSADGKNESIEIASVFRKNSAGHADSEVNAANLQQVMIYIVDNLHNLSTKVKSRESTVTLIDNFLKSTGNSINTIMNLNDNTRQEEPTDIQKLENDIAELHQKLDLFLEEERHEIGVVEPPNNETSITQLTDFLERKFSAIEQEMNKMNDEIFNIDTRVIECEQYSRRESLVISGIPKTVTQEQLEDYVLDITYYMGMDLSSEDIVAAHQLGRPKNLYDSWCAKNEETLKMAEWLSAEGLIYNYYMRNGFVKIVVDEGDKPYKLKHPQSLREKFDYIPDFSFYSR